MFMNKTIKFLALPLCGILLAACAPTTPDEMFRGMTSEQLYQRGEKALAKGKYDEAIKNLEGLENLYPFGIYAEQGQLDLIYAYYKNDDRAQALAAAERYIHLYPMSPKVDYAYYMRGLANFDSSRNWMQRTLKVDITENDLSDMRAAFADFNQLVQRFPNSKYAPDARKRMIYIRNILANYELNVAQFYYDRKAYVAAANRSSYIVKHYEGAPAVVPALALMVRSYRALGVTKSADDAMTVLRLNYPNSPEYRQLAKGK